MLYEFKCNNCGKVFEELRKLKDNTNSSNCPQCGNKSEKIMSTFGFKIVGYSSLNGYSSGNR